MKKTFHEGEPPHVGWWLTDITGQTGAQRWRWWNGLHWSFPAMRWNSARFAEGSASKRTIFPAQDIKWSDHYPTNARVPRVPTNPTPLPVTRETP